MNDLYIVGGQQKKGALNKKEWHRHKQGLILRVNPQRGISEVCTEYVTPPEACATEDPSILFKAGTVEDGKLYACTPTEVLIYTLPHFEQFHYLSLPFFNDLHHVQPTAEGNLLIAVTGLDMVVEVTPLGEVLREWNVLGQDPWDRFSRQTDYRQVLTTKPHLAHPNYVFQIGKDIWVTRFEQRDAICLTQTHPQRCIEIGVERPHDGNLYEEYVYFTTVDGHIVVANLNNGQVEQIVDLNEISETNGRILGWCRGLHILDRDHVIVGFSRLRPTKFRENLRWARHRLGLHKSAGNLPTRIALYNLKQHKLCWEQNLEEAEMSVIFSIHPVGEQMH